MEIGPILRAMARNKLGVILIAVQIAVTMTVIINAVFIINERSRLMARPSGIDESNTFYLSSIGFGDNFNEEITLADDMQLLRQLPGVVSASVTNAIPLSGSGSGTSIQLVADESVASLFTAIYRGDEHLVDTMNVELIAGTSFTASDMRFRQRTETSPSSKTIISEAFAKKLFPDDKVNDVVGKTVYMTGGIALQIIGIVERLQAPWPSSNIESSILVPETIIDGSSIYLIRTEPGERDRLMAEVEELLVANNSSRIIRNLKSLEETRKESYSLDSAMSTILWIVVGTLVFINCMGIVGLAVFGINRRRKQIGTRRALGATKLEILRHFMLENFLMTAIGVSVGAVLTIGFSILLTSNFNMPPMAWYYTPLGMLALLLMGQIAVFGPSRGAAKTEPAIATRSI